MGSTSHHKVIFHGPESHKKSGNQAPAKEWKKFMSSKPSDIFRDTRKRKRNETTDPIENEELKRVMKQIQAIGVAQMSWKERKKIETEKMLDLGAKAPKSYRMPIAVGRAIKNKEECMKQKAMMNQEVILGRPAKRPKEEKNHRRGDKGLVASDGVFRNGVLHVKPLKGEEPVEHMHRKGKGKGKGKGKKKGKSKKHKGKGKKKGKSKKHKGKRK